VLEAVGARLFFLPPLSPEFSPIEPFCSSKVKDALKSLRPRTYQAFKKAIDITYQKMSLDDIRNWLLFAATVLHPSENRYINIFSKIS